MEAVPSTEVIRRGTLRSALWQRLGSVSERTVRVRRTKTSTRPAVPVLVLVPEPAATPSDDSQRSVDAEGQSWIRHLRTAAGS